MMFKKATVFKKATAKTRALIIIGTPTCPHCGKLIDKHRLTILPTDQPSIKRYTPMYAWPEK